MLVSANGGVKAVLEDRFSQIEFVDIPFMEITYPKDGNMVKHFIVKGFSLVKSIWQEHQILQKLIRERNIDLVISDSRFGLWTSKAKCIFVTHQVQIMSPVFQGLINRLNRWVVSRYDEVWIPDYEKAPGFAGDLSHPHRLPINARYIGPLSRFEVPLVKKPIKWDAIAIISGPEPQRSLFEAELTRRFIESGKPALIVQGKPDEPRDQQIDNLRVVNHLDDTKVLEELAQAEKVISRSGYSSIMDYHVLEIEAELHPTPGQTEQEFLAQLHGS